MKYVLATKNPKKLEIHLPGREPYIIWDEREAIDFIDQAMRARWIYEEKGKDIAR